MNTFLVVFLSIVILVCLIAILYIVLYNKIQALNIRVNEAETSIDDDLREKYDLIMESEKIIKKATKKEINLFDDLRELKNQDISNFDFDRKIQEAFRVIKQVKADYESLEKNKTFTKIINSINNTNEKLEAAKAFYNKYTSKLNELLTKFPTNIIALIHRIKVKTYFDGKNMFDEDIEDFKL